MGKPFKSNWCCCGGVLVHSSLHSFPTCLTSSSISNPHTDSGLFLKPFRGELAALGSVSWLSSFSSWTDDSDIFWQRAEFMVPSITASRFIFQFPSEMIKEWFCGLCIIVLSPSLTNRRSVTRWTQLLWLVWDHTDHAAFCSDWKTTSALWYFCFCH